MGRTKVFGEHEDNTLEQLHDVASRAERAALMADGHLGYTMPVGGVTAYREEVSIAGVGVDIGCGNAAARTDMQVEDLGLAVEDFEESPESVRTNRRARELADTIFEEIAFGPGRVNEADDAPTDHEVFDGDVWGLLPNDGPEEGLRDGLREKARRQLGTIGGGNHYVDILVDGEGYLWVGVHFGSRALGYQISSNFLALSAGKPWGETVRDHEGLIHLRNPIGHDYWHLMDLAGRYAWAGREWVVEKVADLMGASELTDHVHNNHNFAWREEHEGEEFVVVRKGATPAFPDQRGFVGGSMGDDAVILRGVETEDGSMENWLQRQAMFSTVHGAGRVMGRREAKRTVEQESMDDWLAERGVVLRGGDLDESPQAYRRLPDVLEAHAPTIEVEHRLRPLIVCMAP